MSRRGTRENFSRMDGDGTAHRAAVVVVVWIGAATAMLSMKLAPIELACLRWLSNGKTVTQIALLEGLTGAEIDAHIASALKALGSKTILDALKSLDLRD